MCGIAMTSGGFQVPSMIASLFQLIDPSRLGEPLLAQIVHASGPLKLRCTFFSLTCLALSHAMARKKVNVAWTAAAGHNRLPTHSPPSPRQTRYNVASRL
jgi:hypothetical protein